MINYQLYIENQLMDVDEKLSFPLNKILEELNDPTLIKVEWSKTIQLPMTDNNNLFFGNYFRLDNVTVADVNGSISGVYFDPTQKLNFRIMYNSDIVMEGYAKMLSNNNSSTKKAYELSLYGKLGEVLNKIKNLTLKKPTTIDPEEITEEEKLYIGYSEDEWGNPDIDDILTPGLKLNKELVKASFEHDKPVTDLSLAGDLDIIGFAMSNRGLYEEFDSKNFVTTNNKIEPIDKYINEHNFKGVQVSDSNSFFPNGLGELACRELRSYYQKPYIYVNKVIQLVRNYINNNTDYTFKLSPTWFNDTNPYYSRLIMMLNSLDVKKSDTLVNSYGVSNNSSLLMDSLYTGANLTKTTLLNLTTINEQYHIVEDNELMVADESKIFVVNNNLNFQLKVRHANVAGLGSSIKFRKDAGLELTFTNVPDNGSIYKILLVGPTNSEAWLKAQELIYDQVITTEAGARFVEGSSHFAYINFKGSDVISVVGKHLFKSEDTNYKLQLKARMTVNVGLFTDTSEKNAGWFDANIIFQTAGALKSITTININENKRSERIITLKDLFPDDYKISDILLNYAKMFNLMWDVDYVNRTITLIDKASYYANNTIEDWTNKIDRTQDMIQTPNTFDAKYVLLNTDDSDNKYNKAYKEKYEMNYGSYKLTTRYNFNEEKKDLFKGIKPSIVSSEYHMDIGRMLNLDFSVKQSEMILPALFKSDGDKKSDIETIGSFYFRNPNKLSGNKILNSPSSNLTEQIYITDDWMVMDMNDSYCWGDLLNTSSNGVQVNVYPYIDIITNNQLYGCTFNKPSEFYTYTSKLYPNGYSTTTQYIYDACWKNWINERYNINSKVLTGYFDLSLVDYNLFQFNKFVSIGHNLYSVNNIYDFDVNGLKTTKASLLRIADKDNYVNANVKFDFIESNVTNFTITGNASQEIKVKSSGSWYVHSKSDWIKLLDSNNQVVTSSTKTELTLHTQTIAYNGLVNRSGIIVLKTNTGKSCTITVTQYPPSPYINCTICVTMDKGNSERTTIRSNRSWSASSDVSWITLNKINVTTLGISCSTNTTGNSRVGTITITVSGLSKTIKVVQPADGVYVNNNNLFLDSFNLDKTTLNLVAAGTTQIVKLVATYSWDVIDKPSWVNINPSYGSGNKTLYISATATSESRSGVIIFGTLGRNRKYITLNINQTV